MAYNKAKEEAREAYEKFNALRQKNDLASVKNYLKDNKELLALNDYANKLSEVIKYSRDQQDLIKLSKDLTIAEKRLKIKEEYILFCLLLFSFISFSYIFFQSSCHRWCSRTWSHDVTT